MRKSENQGLVHVNKKMRGGELQVRGIDLSSAQQQQSEVGHSNGVSTMRGKGRYRP